MPLLEWEPPAHGSDIKLKELLKNQNPVNLRKIMTVREIVRILKMTRNWPRETSRSFLPQYDKKVLSPTLAGGLCEDNNP